MGFFAHMSSQLCSPILVVSPSEILSSLDTFFLVPGQLFSDPGSSAEKHSSELLLNSQFMWDCQVKLVYACTSQGYAQIFQMMQDDTYAYVSK